MFNSAVSTEIVPRPGESMTAAIFREHDRFARTGHTATDQTAIVADDAGKAAHKLAECAQRCADLVVTNTAHVATIHQLQESLAAAQKKINELQGQLYEATANAASDADAKATAEVAWALHVEGIR